MLNGSDSASNPASAASKGDSQRARLHCADNINRFLVDQDQCAPVGLGPVQTQDETKAAGEARASANISAFNRQFGCGNTPPGTKSTQK
ncbi:uncharacterized protein TrAFT101_004853 [Trichoderma asperellum]|nr:hypothetical protein TrAFT101_004853 [Trichoderma asperellum]